MVFLISGSGQFLLIISLLHFGMQVEILRSVLYPISMKNLFFLTTTTMRKIALLIFLLLTGVCVMVQAQSVGNWTFNNVLSGTPSSSNTVSAASLGSNITSGAFNGGTVYYGEDGWPSGAMSTNAYLEFSLTPNSGHTLSLSGIVMNIRRSTTGTPSGSGPNTWSLRSSLDGYSTDITSGTLTTNSTPSITVALPGAFTGLSSAVSFRLYGYNATVTSGGLNRFVYDNITVNGLVTLAAVIENFKANIVNNDAVTLNWTMSSDEFTSASVERSTNGSDYFPVKDLTPAQNGIRQEYSFVDEPAVTRKMDFFYRIKMSTAGGNISYSPVQKITVEGKNEPDIIPLATNHGGSVRFKIKIDETGNYQFSLFNTNGTRVAASAETLGGGMQLVTMNNQPLITGVYILLAEKNGKKISSKIWIE